MCSQLHEQLASRNSCGSAHKLNSGVVVMAESVRVVVCVAYGVAWTYCDIGPVKCSAHRHYRPLSLDPGWIYVPSCLANDFTHNVP
jgi:hypothetical protein